MFTCKTIFYCKRKFPLKSANHVIFRSMFFSNSKIFKLKKCERVQVPKKEKFIVESKNVPNGETDEMI